ncbi:MAG: peptide chain release factor N(5)-glutamine methyltransferase [Dehalococcoidia bacterium]|nr:peptide chain release factor N(5)-glutamine methyltransferase [Dehalococcoidia bacterium]
MKLIEALNFLHQRFNSADIEEAQLESELLIRHVLGYDAGQLFLHYERKLTSAEESLLQSFLFRRLNGEPLAYIVGHREFYGLEFYLNSHVLIPRPETEHLVEKVLELAQFQTETTIADIGTGSGIIAVTLAQYLPKAKIYATDISLKALEVARSNASRHAVDSKITFLKGDLLNPLPETIDIIIANLPYVKSMDCRDSFEPLIALDGGVDGLEVIKRLCVALPAKLKPDGQVLLEIGQGQAEQVINALQTVLPNMRTQTIKDLSGIERIVHGENNTQAPLIMDY